MPKNQDRLTIRLDADMRAKLHERAAALGLDDAAFVRMLIYGSINDVGLGLGAASASLVRESVSAWPATAAHDVEAPVEPDDRAEDFEVPPDADGGIPLDDLLRAGPSILDQGMTPAPQPASRPTSQTYRSALPQRSYGQPARGPQAPYGRPGSITRAIGVNDGAVGAGVEKYQHANVLRRNMGHFGIRETR